MRGWVGSMKETKGARNIIWNMCERNNKLKKIRHAKFTFVFSNLETLFNFFNVKHYPSDDYLIHLS